MEFKIKRTGHNKLVNAPLQKGRTLRRLRKEPEALPEFFGHDMPQALAAWEDLKHISNTRPVAMEDEEEESPVLTVPSSRQTFRDADDEDDWWSDEDKGGGDEEYVQQMPLRGSFREKEEEEGAHQEGGSQPSISSFARGGQGAAEGHTGSGFALPEFF